MGSSNDIASRQRTALSASGIAGDVLRGLDAFWGAGEAVLQTITTPGDGVNHQLLPNVDYVLPELTVLADPGNAVNVKVGRIAATVPLAAGSSMTLDKVNPVRSKLVFNDGGTAGLLLHVWS